MDTPEQPTVWPPAPTLPPPEAEKRQPFKLPLPEWIAVTLKESAYLIMLLSVLEAAINLVWTHQILLNHWTDYALMTLTALILYGIKDWLKFHPKA